MPELLDDPLLPLEEVELLGPPDELDEPPGCDDVSPALEPADEPLPDEEEPVEVPSEDEDSPEPEISGAVLLDEAFEELESPDEVELLLDAWLDDDEPLPDEEAELPEDELLWLPEDDADDEEPVLLEPDEELEPLLDAGPLELDDDGAPLDEVDEDEDALDALDADKSLELVDELDDPGAEDD